MKIEIQERSLRLSAHGKALIVHWRDVDGTEIVSFEVNDGRFSTGGLLPAVEMSKREVILRHIGNRIEQVRR